VLYQLSYGPKPKAASGPVGQPLEVATRSMRPDQYLPTGRLAHRPT
jgi:hypothetical protein